MADFIELINNQINSLRNLLDESTSRGRLSEGHLLMRGRKKQPAFYLCDGQGRIPKGSHRLSSELAYEIARNKYYAVLDSRLKNNIALLEKVLGKYQLLDEKSLMQELPLVYQEALLICGGEALNEQGGDSAERNGERGACLSGKATVRNAGVGGKAAKRGRTRKRKSLKNVMPIENAHIAIDGTPVRSLGEVIIYNALLRHSVDFEYEAEIVLIGKGGELLVRYPDFTIHLRDRKVYWEHVGMYGDEEYRKAYEEKIKLYYENEIVLGLNLVVTFAQQSRYIDSRMIDSIARSLAEMDEVL